MRLGWLSIGKVYILWGRGKRKTAVTIPVRFILFDFCRRANRFDRHIVRLPLQVRNSHLIPYRKLKAKPMYFFVVTVDILTGKYAVCNRWVVLSDTSCMSRLMVTYMTTPTKEGWSRITAILLQRGRCSFCREKLLQLRWWAIHTGVSSPDSIRT